MHRTIVAGFTFAAALGCTLPMDPPPSAGISQSLNTENGISLNGISLNGISLNGISLNGISLNGISLNGISLNGISLNGISLNGTSLDAAMFVGSSWIGLLSDGSSLAMRIDAASQGTGANSDLGLYQVSYQTAAGWQPLCGVAAGVPVEAVAVPGTWNQAQGVPGGGAYASSTTLFSWACRGTTIAKCAEFGYKPWTGRTPQLASCVRLLRADYCGDGVPHTTDGLLVNLYDNVGILSDTARWTVEAEWTPSGARCITRTGVTRFREVGLPAPSCAAALSRSTSCGSFANGAVLVDEILY
jgi:hypothetical protein